MVIEENIETLRKSALDHSFMLGDWVQMAEEGGPQFIVEGKGIRVTDSDGKQWIDANSGYASVNVGYGGIELDVLSSLNGVIYCSHNHELEKETGSNGYIHQMTSVELDSPS